MHDRALERDEKLRPRLGRNRADDPARHQEAEGVDRIGGVRNEHDIAGRGDRLGHVGEAFLRAEGRDHLRLGIEFHPEPARGKASLGAAEASDAFRGEKTGGVRLADRFDELVDHMLGLGQVRIAHAEIDDVRPAGAGLGLEGIDLLEDIRRQAPHPMEIAHRNTSPRIELRFIKPMARRGPVASETQGGKRDRPIAGRPAGSTSAFFAPPVPRPTFWRPAERPREARRVLCRPS